MNEKNNISAVVAGKLCTAFYSEDLLMVEHNLISEIRANSFSTFDEDLAYIRGVSDTIEAIFAKMNTGAEK